MALTATVYAIATGISDADRGVYESMDLKLACHPSETPEYLFTRWLAYCLEYEDGICFTGGVSSGDVCAVQCVDLTGQLTHWIEVGAPSAQRLHRGSKLAGRASVYTHRDAGKILESLQGKTIHRAAGIDVVSFDPGFIAGLVSSLQRRNTASVSVSGGQLYLDINDAHFSSAIVRQALVPDRE